MEKKTLGYRIVIELMDLIRKRGYGTEKTSK